MINLPLDYLGIAGVLPEAHEPADLQRPGDTAGVDRDSIRGGGVPDGEPSHHQLRSRRRRQGLNSVFEVLGFVSKRSRSINQTENPNRNMQCSRYATVVLPVSQSLREQYGHMSPHTELKPFHPWPHLKYSSTVMNSVILKGDEVEQKR
jgi:hypothetical protein